MPQVYEALNWKVSISMSYLLFCIFVSFAINAFCVKKKCIFIVKLMIFRIQFLLSLLKEVSQSLLLKGVRKKKMLLWSFVAAVLNYIVNDVCSEIVVTDTERENSSCKHLLKAIANLIKRFIALPNIKLVFLLFIGSQKFRSPESSW